MINTRNRLASLSEYDSPDMSASNDGMPMGSDFSNGPPMQSPNSPLGQLGQQPPTNNAGMMMDYPTPLLDQYRQYLSGGMPNPANYKPGFGQKLLASLGSLGTSPEQGMMYQEHVLKGPYNEAMQQYFTKAKLLGEGANVEEKQIANKRGIAAAEERARIAQERADVYAKEQESKEQDRQNRAQQAIDNLQSKVDDSAKKAEEWKQKFEADQHNRDTINAFHDATLKAIDARHALDIKQKELQLDEMKRQHDLAFSSAERKAKDYEDRTKLWHQYNADRLAGKDVTKYTFDQQGNITGKIETTSAPNIPGVQNPSAPKQTAPAVNQVNPDKDKATKYLQDHGKPVTEANIKYLLDNKGKW